jgi:hypothetical protein
MKTSTVVIALVLAGIGYWLYEYNPGNIFGRS